MDCGVAVHLRVNITVVKHHDQKVPGEESVQMAYTSTSQLIIKGSHDRNLSKAETWRQELKQEPWRGAAYLFAPHGLFSLLPYTA